MSKKTFRIGLCLLPALFLSGGCNLLPEQAEAQSQNPGQERGGATPIDVAIAKTGILEEPLQYTGTTRPVREISLRSQVEGRLLNIQAGAGDLVKRGQILAQIDGAILTTQLTQARAELAALQSEVARAQTQVRNARAQAELARVQLNQAQIDASRRATLGRQGAISQQEAELAQTSSQTAQQTLRAALEQIRTEQQAVAAAQGRVAAQRAAVAQAQERQSYTLLAAPINGVVLAQSSEPGNLIQPGAEILKLGDFSQVKVIVSVSELELSTIRIGQNVQVTLDAYKNDQFPGRVTRIVPAADPTARQLPVEIVIPNSNGRIGSGLLARVSFASNVSQRVVVPETALQERRGQDENNSNKNQASTLFVVTGQGKEAKVKARQVIVGDRANSQVEIISGLQPGERFVSRSGKPLKDGETVRISVLSQK